MSSTAQEPIIVTSENSRVAASLPNSVELPREIPSNLNPYRASSLSIGELVPSIANAVLAESFVRVLIREVIA